MYVGTNVSVCACFSHMRRICVRGYVSTNVCMYVCMYEYGYVSIYECMCVYMHESGDVCMVVGRRRLVPSVCHQHQLQG